MVLPVGCGCDGVDFGLAGFVTGAVATAWVALAIGLIILEVPFASTIPIGKHERRLYAACSQKGRNISKPSAESAGLHVLIQPPLEITFKVGAGGIGQNGVDPCLALEAQHPQIPDGRGQAGRGYVLQLVGVVGG